MAPLATILSHIKGDNVKEAYLDVQIFLEKTDDRESSACSILRALNELIYPALQKNLSCKSEASVIFELSDLCSKWISVTWNCKHLVYIQSIYHIKRYLLSKGFLKEAKQLCSYFFLLYSSKKKPKWEQSEKLVISNSIFNFANFVIEADETFFKEMLEKNSFFSLWKFHADLIELNTLDKLGLNFTMSTKFLTMLHSILGVSRHMETVNKIFLNYGDWFNDFSLKISTVKLTEKDVSSFCALLYSFVHCMSDDELGKFDFNCILYSIKSLLIVVNEGGDIYDALQILLKVVLLCNSLQVGGSVELFLEFKDTLLKKCEIKSKTFLCDVISFSFHLIFKMRSSFVKKPSFLEKILTEFVSILISVHRFIKYSTSSPKNKLIEQVNTLFTALYFTFMPQFSSDTLMEIFKDLRTVFKAFFSITNIVDKNGLLCFGVSGCINVLLTYNKSELYCQSATLAISLMKYLLKVETIYLQSLSMKANISYAINAFALALGKIGHYDTAQVGLLAFVGIHKEFYEAVFSAWLNLKLSGSNSCYMDTTVYDVVQNSKETFENEWSFNIDLLNIDDLLLKEIKAYTKNRSAHGEPVLAVYRTAAKVCTNKLLLAEILVCATDVVTTQPDLPNINSFEMSIANVIQLLSNRQDSADSKDRAHILCLLGNLYYQQARCEIMQLRKKSEAEVVQLELKPKNVVPILQANEGDILNESTVVPTFMYLKLEAQEKVLSLLENAMQFWKKTNEVLQPGSGNEYLHMSLTYIKATAYLYRLYIYKLKELETWELLYEISTKMNINKYRVLAVAELLSIQLQVREDWIQAVKVCIENKDFEKRSYIYHLFIVNTARNAFNNNKVEESQKIIYGLNIAEVRNNFLVYVQFQVLKSILCSVMKKPDDSGIHFSPNEYKPGIIMAVKVFENLLYIISHSKWSTFAHLCVVHCLLLDIASFLGKMYSDMKNVRYARCYTKQQLLLAQRLGLPIRVTELLILLAQLDAYCSNVMDFGFKLRGIETILELESFPNELTYEEEDTSLLSASPVLMNTVKLKPKFSSHELACLCFQCKNIDYQIQSLQAITLRANFFLAKSSFSQVKQLLKVGKTLLKTIYSKYQSMHCNLFTSLVEAEIRFYITIVDALGQWNSIGKALEYCNIAKDRLSTNPVANPLLKNTLFCHENWLKWMQIYVSPKIRRDLTPVGRAPVVENAVTPTNCEPHATNERMVKYLAVPPIAVSPMPVKFRRRLVLENSDDETSPIKDFTNLKVSPKTKPLENIVIKEDATTTTSNNIKIRDHENGNSPKLKKKTQLKKTAQTERKARKNKVNLEMSPETTYQPNKSPFKIYCDAFDDEAPTCTTTTKRRGRPRKRENLINASSSTSVKVGRKLIFDSASDFTQEDDKSKLLAKQSKEEGTGLKSDDDIKTGPTNTSIIDSDHSIIEGTPPDKTNAISNLKISSTPMSLLREFDKLSLSNKSKTKICLTRRITRSKATNVVKNKKNS